MFRKFRSISVVLALLASIFVPTTAAHATDTTHTGVRPTKLETGTIDFSNPGYWPWINNPVENSSAGLIDANPYDNSASSQFQLTFGGQAGNFPSGSCLKDLTLNITGSPLAAGWVVYTFNYAKFNISGEASSVKSVDDYTGMMMQYRASANNRFFYSWGGYLWAPATPETPEEVTYSMDMSLANLPTADFKNGKFVITISGVGHNPTTGRDDIIKSVNIDYTVTDTGCPIPITVSAESDTKDFDNTTTSDGVPTVTSGTLQAGDALDPATCTQAFNSATAGNSKTLVVNSGCKIMNGATDNTHLYSIDFASASGVINKLNASCTVTGYDVIYDGASHTATGSCTGLGGASVSGLNLSSTTHTAVGNYVDDPWTFSNANYNSLSGTVTNVIRPDSVPVGLTYTGATEITVDKDTGRASVPLSVTISPDSPDCEVTFVALRNDGDSFGPFSTTSLSGTASTSASLPAGKYTITTSVSGDCSADEVTSSLTVKRYIEPTPYPFATPAQVIGGDQKLTVKVTPPTEGKTPASYVAIAQPSGYSCVITAPATSCVISGLNPDTEYSVEITAYNSSSNATARTVVKGRTLKAVEDEEANPVAKTYQATVASFAPDRYAFTAKIKATLKKLAVKIKKAGSTEITCVGSTSGPTVRPTDVKLALNRAKAVCRYLKSKVSTIESFEVIAKTTKKNTASIRRVVVTY